MRKTATVVKLPIRIPHILFAVLLLIVAISVTGCRGACVDPFAAKLDSLISRSRIEQTMEAIASKPHPAGSEQNRVVGNFLLKALSETGLKTTTAEYQATVHEPIAAELELVTGANREKLEICERALPEDPYTDIAPSELPFFAYSPDANLEAEVVFANYGRKEDYDVLREQGISVSGKIVLLRAQGICRGMKSIIAEQEGAAALLLYPELKDQGFLKPVYPQGLHLPPWTFMRGSMARYFIQPGDPFQQTTARGKSLVPGIPALPISQETARRIFEKLEGPAAPESWKGTMPVKYTLGPGPLKLKMVYRGQNMVKTIRNIFGELPGSHPAEGTIIVGCHYDAWVYGATDPSSGTTSVLETARVLTAAKKGGWIPRRNIKFAFWDAEEYGMFGSTKWVQENLSNSSITAYINISTAVRAHEFLGNVMPGLRQPLDEVLEKVKDPVTETLLSEVRPQFRLPGFSTDTTPFLGMTGIPIAEIGFGRWYSVNHSIYDNLNWYSLFNDPGYRYTATLIKILSLYVHDLSGKDVLPYRFSEIGEFAQASLLDLKGIPQNGPLQAEINRFLQTAQKSEAMDASSWPDERKSRVNSTVLEAIQSFAGVSGPFGQQNLLVGPSPTEGCSACTLSRLRSALDQQDPQIQKQEVERLIQAFARARRLLESAMQNQ